MTKPSSFKSLLLATYRQFRANSCGPEFVVYSFVSLLLCPFQHWALLALAFGFAAMAVKSFVQVALGNVPPPPPPPIKIVAGVRYSKWAVRAGAVVLVIGLAGYFAGFYSFVWPTAADPQAMPGPGERVRPPRPPKQADPEPRLVRVQSAGPLPRRQRPPLHAWNAGRLHQSVRFTEGNPVAALMHTEDAEPAVQSTAAASPESAGVDVDMWERGKYFYPARRPAIPTWASVKNVYVRVPPLVTVQLPTKLPR